MRLLRPSSYRSNLARVTLFRATEILSYVVVFWFLLHVIASPLAASVISSLDAASVSPRLERTLKTIGSPTALQWSPNGKLLAAVGLDGQIVVWDYAAGIERMTITRKFIWPAPMAFTADNRYIVTAAVSPERPNNRQSLSLIDSDTGQIARNVEGPFVEEPAFGDNLARQLAISHDGKYVAVVNRRDLHDYLTLYETSTWRLIHTYLCPQTVRALEFNPATDDLGVLHGTGLLEIWEPSQFRLLDKRQVFDRISSGTLTFSADGKYLATSEGIGFAGETPNSSIRLWNTTDLELLATVPFDSTHDFRARSLSFSPDGRYLASLNYDGNTRLWDAKALTMAETIHGNPRAGALAFSPDGKRFAIADETGVTVLRF